MPYGSTGIASGRDRARNTRPKAVVEGAAALLAFCRGTGGNRKVAAASQE
jgi:hypothetical protein